MTVLYSSFVSNEKISNEKIFLVLFIGNKRKSRKSLFAASSTRKKKIFQSLNFAMAVKTLLGMS